jgi:hypothetical protein
MLLLLIPKFNWPLVIVIGIGSAPLIWINERERADTNSCSQFED